MAKKGLLGAYLKSSEIPFLYNNDYKAKPEVLEHKEDFVLKGVETVMEALPKSLGFLSSPKSGKPMEGKSFMMEFNVENDTCECSEEKDNDWHRSYHAAEGIDGFKKGIMSLFTQFIKSVSGIMERKEGLRANYGIEFTVLRYPDGRIGGKWFMDASILEDGVETPWGVKDGITKRYYTATVDFNELGESFK